MKADCHMHMVLDGVDWKAAIRRHENGPDRAFIREILSRYRDLGYEYLRDGGDRWGVGQAAREMAAEFGIVYRTPLANLCLMGHYGAFIGEKYENLKEYAALVKKQREKGADFIKIMISGLMDFDHFGRLTEEGLDPKLIRELIRIAHEEGFSVMAHANGARTVQAAAEAGLDSVEHGAYLDEEALKAMEENGTVWVPTISTVGNLRGKGRFDESAVAAIFDSTMENLSRYGGLVAIGSDAGAWAVGHGCETEEALLLQVCSKERLQEGVRKIREKF